MIYPISFILWLSLNWLKKIVNKTELIDIVAKKSGMTKVETESLLTITLETIVETVAKGERVTLVGFGSFEAR